MRDSFRFAHRLTADAAHGALLRANRRVLHSAAADALAPRIVSGTVDEVALRRRLLDHLLASERWLEAHECACSLLDRSASAARIEDWDEHCEAAERAWRAAKPGTGPVEEESAVFAYALSSLAELRGESETTARLCTLTLHLAREHNQPAAAAWALERLAWLSFNSGRIAESEALRDEALQLARQSADWVAEARILDGMGNQLLYNSRFDEAWELMERARQIYREHGNVRHEAALLMNWASGKRMQGRFAEAQKIRLQALRLARECADRRLEAWLLGNIANYLSHSGDVEGAISQGQLAISLLREMGDRATVAQFTANLASFYSQASDHKRAEEHLQRAIADQREIGDLHQTAISLANLGNVHRLLERSAEGCAELEEAAEIFETYADLAWLGWTRLELGRSLAATGQPAAAAASFQAAAAALRAGGEPQDLLETLTEWLELCLDHPAVQDNDTPPLRELLVTARAEALRSESPEAGEWLRRLEQLEARLDRAG